MNRNNAAAKSFFDNNKILFVFSLIVAVVFWCGVSMTQTTETERIVKDVRVTVDTSSLTASGSELEIYGKNEFFVDVTVKGYSYLVNASALSADNLIVTASAASVVSAGEYDLPLSCSLSGVSGEIQIVNMSSSTVRVDFDKIISKSFSIVEDIAEGENYALAEGYQRENPRLSAETVSLTGPARIINQITAVKAHVEINKEITATERFEATIIAENEEGPLDMTYIKLDSDTPIYITIPVNYITTYEPVVDFTGVPQSYRSGGIPYKITPSAIDVSVVVSTTGLQVEDSNKLTVASIDFSDINNNLNTYRIQNTELTSSTTEFTVTIDMSSMSKRWLEIAVDAKAASLPENVSVISKSVESVQIVGPEASVGGIDSSCAYAVPVLDNLDLSKPGTYTVPAKIVLRTLTDSWVHGKYTVEVLVK